MWIRSLISIIEKDLKILGRSKFSAFAIIFTPLLIILFAGSAFNSSSLSGIVVATYSDSYTSLTEDILAGFESQDFGVNRFGSQKECIDSVKLSKSQICVLFPDDLSVTGSAKNIIFHVDHSRINLAYTLVHDIESKISVKASSLGTALAQDLVDVLQEAKDSLPKQQKELANSMMKLNQINEQTKKNVTTEDFETAISKLEDAKAIANGSEAGDKISETIVLIKSLQSSNLQLSNDLNEINSQSQEVSSALYNATFSIEEIIKSLKNVNVIEAEKIVSPIRTQIESVNSDSNNRNYLLPTLLSLIALFGGILLSSTFVMKEKKTKAFFRNFITPTKDWTFVFGSYLTCLIILFVQFLLIFAGIQWFLKIQIFDIFPNIALVLLVSLTMFIFLGMFIGYAFRSEETTIFSSVLVAAVLMFFSNTIFPVETISESFKKFAMFNPLYVCNTALKKIILFDFSYSAISSELLIIFGFLIVFVGLTYLGRMLTRRML